MPGGVAAAKQLLATQVWQPPAKLHHACRPPPLAVLCVRAPSLADPVSGLLLSCLPDIKLAVLENPAALDKAWDITLASGQQVKKTSQVGGNHCTSRL